MTTYEKRWDSEFRNHATSYLTRSEPVAVSNRGFVIGFYIPSNETRGKPHALCKVQQILSETGMSGARPTRVNGKTAHSTIHNISIDTASRQIGPDWKQNIPLAAPLRPSCPAAGGRGVLCMSRVARGFLPALRLYGKPAAPKPLGAIATGAGPALEYCVQHQPSRGRCLP